MADNAKQAKPQPGEAKIEIVEVKLPSLEDFLKAGAHFGHKTSRWNPKMEDYIYAEKGGIHIIDIVKTMSILKEVIPVIEEAADAGNVLLVGTKGQAATLVKKAAEEAGAFYVNSRWPGGLFTNFKMIKKSINKLMSMEEKIASGAKGMVKKEQLLLQRDVERLNKLYEGMKFMENMPTLVIVVDSRIEKIAIQESKSTDVEVVALVDTNCDPTLVDFPVPANDDSIKSISLFMSLFTEAIKKGKRSKALVTMRNEYNNKLTSLRAEFEQATEKERLMKEEERERMKRLRSGQAVAAKEASERAHVEGSVVRVVQHVEKADTPVESLDLPTRTKNALVAAGYKNASELKGKKKAELTEIKGIGDKAADEVLAALK